MGTLVTDILQLRNLRPLAVREEDGAYLIEAEGRVLPMLCSHCGTGRLHGHGSQQQTYRDTPHHGRPVQILINRRRFRCQNIACGKTLFEPVSDLDDKRLTTKRLIQYIRQRSTRETFASVARDIGMDEKTVRQVFADYVDELESTIRFETPRFLGIDELKIIGAYRAILTNIEHRTVFDLRETRSKPDLLKYFGQLRDKDKIEWVAMDMYDVYRQVVHATLPQARIVVDKFHIQRMANEVLEVMRKRVRKSISQRQRLKLKDERFLLLKRQHDLSQKQMEQLFAWFQQFPLLGEAHALKEGFLNVWAQPTRAAAEVSFDKWLANLTPELKAEFKVLTTAMQNWREEVFAYFDNPITNAYTESANNIAKGMNRMGRGYSFEVIRARLLYDLKARKDGAKIHNKPLEPEDMPGAAYFSMMGAGKEKRPRIVRRVVEYGPYIPTLVRLLDEGYFER